MAKVPITAKKEIPQKCRLCNKKFNNKASLVSHIERVHGDSIPEGWSAARYENYLRSNKTHGSCVVCKNDTTWNDATWKYNRTCNSKKCNDVLHKKAIKNVKAVYGKENLLDDPEMQRKMIYSKRNSGKYTWSSEETGDNYNIMYASSVERDFLEMLDVFLNLSPTDILGPSPNTYQYKYDGKMHHYIPDYYIPSINLEIEMKEPADNQNMHPKIQAVDKVKEKLKDEMMEKQPDVNYIKINGSDYSKFFQIFSYLKYADTDTDVVKNDAPHMFVREGADDELISTLESVSALEEVSNLHQLEIKMNQLSSVTDLLTPKLSYDKMVKNYRARIKKIKSVKEANELITEMNLAYDQLGLIVKDDRGNNELAYSARKTREIIKNRLIPQVNDKMSRLSESYIDNTWFTDEFDDETMYDGNVTTIEPDETMDTPEFKFINDDSINPTQLINELKYLVSSSNNIIDVKNANRRIKEVESNMEYIISNNSNDNSNAKTVLDAIHSEIKPSQMNKFNNLSESMYVMTEASHIEGYKDGVTYTPVFIFLSFTNTGFGKLIRRVTKQKYSHASLSLNTKLSKMVSFGTRRDGKMGFVPDEDINWGGYTNDGAYCALYMYMAPQHEYSTILDTIDSFKEKETDLKYSFAGCINILFNKSTNSESEYFCSEFVSTVLSEANPKLFKKNPSLYTPGDLSTTRKFIKVYDGPISKYKESSIDNKITSILKRKGFTNISIQN